MPGNSAASLVANYLGNTAASIAKSNAGTIGMAVGGGLAGGTAGAIGGRVWDYEGRGFQGAMGGMVAGAGLALGARGGAGAMRMGFSGMKSGMASLAKQHHVASNMAIGGAIGAFAGPSDSTFANIGMGAMAGGTGAVLGGRLGAHIGNQFAAGPKGTYFGHSLGRGTARGPAFVMGKRGAKKGNPLDRFSVQGRHLSTSRIGATAAALFAPAAAHGLIGGSRRDKSMNQFNRY